MEKYNESVEIPADPQRPRWDAAKRILWLGDKLVKRFTTLAPIQEQILACFEKHEWASPIRVPVLTGHSKRSPQDRLHDAVVALNGHQEDVQIYFFRSGRGNEIGWELTPTHTKKAKGKE